MEITDIMVSFWVSYNNEPHQIKKISGTDVVLDSEKEDGVCINVDINDCEPIKITNALLEECGFCGIKEKFMFGNEDNILIITYNEENDDYVMSVSLHDASAKMKYVHELQMALKSLKRDDIVIDPRFNNLEFKPGNWVVNKEDEVIYRLIEKTESGIWSACHRVPEGTVELSSENIEAVIVRESLLDINGIPANENGLRIKETDDFYFEFVNYDQWTIRNKITGKFFCGAIKYLHQLQNIFNYLKIDFDWIAFADEDKSEEIINDFLEDSLNVLEEETKKENTDETI